MYLILAITVALAAFFVTATVVPWVRNRMADPDISPDMPQPFGYHTAWIAIEGAETAAVVEALDLSHLQCVNWRTGIKTIYDEEFSDDFVFISPTVEGRTFVVGLALPHPVGARFEDRCHALLEKLSRTFGRVSYYFSYPVIEVYGWARYVDGRADRAFAWGDEGVLWNRGAVTAVEQALDLSVLTPPGPRPANDIAPSQARELSSAGFPTEADVLTMAAAWSKDPTALDLATEKVGLGFIGQAPADWRVKRIKRKPEARRVKTPAERRAELRPVS